MPGRAAPAQDPTGGCHGLSGANRPEESEASGDRGSDRRNCNIRGLREGKTGSGYLFTGGRASGSRAGRMSGSGGFGERSDRGGTCRYEQSGLRRCGDECWHRKNCTFRFFRLQGAQFE